MATQSGTEIHLDNVFSRLHSPTGSSTIIQPFTNAFCTKDTVIKL